MTPVMIIAVKLMGLRPDYKNKPLYFEAQFPDKKGCIKFFL